MPYTAEAQQLAKERIADIKQMLADRKDPKPVAPPVVPADDDIF
jgi:hypothetical protein